MTTVEIERSKLVYLSHSPMIQMFLNVFTTHSGVAARPNDIIRLLVNETHVTRHSNFVVKNTTI